jgi:phosphoglucosamine mutase
MSRLFGTDGVRGLANKELTPELAMRLGRVAGFLAVKEGRGKVLIGRDTRLSGEMLSTALMAGITSSGADAYDLGIIPTPGVAYLCRTLEADYGAVISASHNPFDDNGVKFFDKDGFKLSDEEENYIASFIVDDNGEFIRDALPYPTAEGIGRIHKIEDAHLIYANYIKEISKVSLKGYKIALDCANGASYEVSPKVLESLGAELILLNAEPNGKNINQGCGSTHPEQIKEAVIRSGAYVGIAHDGDADRVVFVDEKGELVDGDHIMAILALDLLERNELPNKAIAVTVYSNLGLKDVLLKNGAAVHITDNGDRYVLQEMKKSGLVLGGEQSGHIILLNHNTTGDGLIAAIKLLEVLVRKQKPLSELAAQMTTFPQLLVNVKVKDKSRVMESEVVKQAVRKASEELNQKGEGRLFVRPSGTEPLIRVMGEARDGVLVRRIVNEVAAAIASVEQED